ncbi:MAG: hypothetical protein R3F62_15065 [Planctomycetota bacterium]
MTLRINYFDVVQRAVGVGDARRLAQAIERLSATFRMGRPLSYTDAETRRAYLWHLLPAHVTDVSQLLEDHPELFQREALTVVALGAGPGSEVLAFLDVLTRRRERGEEDALRKVEVLRVDQYGSWDKDFAALLRTTREACAPRDPAFGEAYDLEAPTQGLIADLTLPLGAPVKAALQRADLVLGINLLSELPPRGEPELPDGTVGALTQLYGLLPPGARVWWVDREGAPGVRERLEQAAELGLTREGVTRGEVKVRHTRCGSQPTKATRTLYNRVKLPTTKDKDQPVLNCRTAWVSSPWRA